MISSGKSLKVTPVHAYVRQRVSASKRGIGFTLSLWEWWSIWKKSGNWNERGLGYGYVMCRKGDKGNYSIGNVYIDTAINNTSKYSFKKSNLPTGVTVDKNRYKASRVYRGKRYYIGYYDTPEEAGKAYADSVSAGIPRQLASRNLDSEV